MKVCPPGRLFYTRPQELLRFDSLALLFSNEPENVQRIRFTRRFPDDALADFCRCIEISGLLQRQRALQVGDDHGIHARSIVNNRGGRQSGLVPAVAVG